MSVRLDPPRRERKISGMTIDQIDSVLKGAAKQRWLEKWIRWIDELMDAYGIDDPQVIGLSELEPEEVEKFLLEHCHGLTESECIDKIEAMIREKGATKTITEEIADDLRDMMEEYERKLLWLPQDIRAKIEYFKQHPWEDGEKVFQLVKDFLVKQGMEETEAEVLATEVSLLIPKIDVKKRAEVLEAMLRRASMARQQALDKWMKQMKRAEEKLEKIHREIVETEKELKIWRKPSIAMALDRIVTELEKLDIDRGIAERLVRKYRAEMEKEYAFVTSPEDYEKFINKWIGILFREYAKLRRPIKSGTVGEQLFYRSFDGEKLARYIERWAAFLGQLYRIYGIPYEEVFGTKDIRKILEEYCWDLSETECEKRLSEIYQKYAEEKAIVKPMEVGRAVRLTLAVRPSIETAARMLSIQLPRAAPTPVPTKPVAKPRVPEEAEEYFLDELPRLGIEVLQAQSWNIYQATAKLRLWCLQNRKPIEMSNALPRSYNIRLFYFPWSKPTKCWIERKGDKIVFYGCDKPVVVIAWNDKCVIAALLPVT